MENQHKIDQKFLKAAENNQEKTFPEMDKVWAKIEKKLDQKDSKKVISLWKKLTVAASIALLIGLGFQIFNANDLFKASENPVVIENDHSTEVKTGNDIKPNENIINEKEAQKIIEHKTSTNNNAVTSNSNKTTEDKKTPENDVIKASVTTDAIALENDITIGDIEIINAGYSRTETRTTSALTKINARDIQNGYVYTEKTASGEMVLKESEVKTESSFLQSLQGTVSGLNIIASSGKPGESHNSIILRGSGSINGNPDPFFLIDGELLTEDQFRKLNSNDIEEFKIIKEEIISSNGTKLTNGIILIKTKKNKKKNVKIENGSVFYNGKKIIFPPSPERPKVKINTESYESFTENPFENTQSNPLSTFSIDVDNASYTNIRRFINNGQIVPKDAVRIEEMINFFKYDYPLPKSEHPFSINTEYSDAPWNPNHKLLRIALKGKEIPADNLPKSNFVFLVDVSGSMNAPNKLPLLKASMKVLLKELRDDDRVSIVYYANNAGILLEPTKASEKKKIIEVIDQMYASGGTSGGSGLELAYQMAEKHLIKGGNNRIILATDGDFNIGRSSDKDMQELIEEKRKSGIFLTCLGFGMGNYKDSKMVTLSKKGNGNYAYIDNIQEANRFLGKEFKGSMFAIAKDVKIQIEFNQAHVQAYRLIGYEMRKLRNEDFTNDAIDAGELGSGHTVTALYEVIPVGTKSSFPETIPELKYTQTNAVGNIYTNELGTVKFRYKKPDGEKSIEMIHIIPNKSVALEKSSPDFKFATAVAWFGLKLRDSKLILNKSSKEISNLAKKGIDNDPDGYRAEFIRLVESVD